MTGLPEGYGDWLAELKGSITQARQRAALAFKDPDLSDFFGFDEDVHDHDIEDRLLRRITRFLMERGDGFAFVGRQFRVEINGDNFFIDLLFYHTRLRCYVVVELEAMPFQTAAFKPEHAGKLNFYLAAVDAQIKADDDKPSIGLLLCRQQNRLVAEYSLAGIDKPIGVAEYQLLRDLPENLGRNLPSIAELEAELSGDISQT